ncbi:MAG TPA: DUF4142 domain-containing protein [Longimicrobium sp.]|nr:DUF4142 domain-containing protein [Longimicrobium sp.]
MRTALFLTAAVLTAACSGSDAAEETAQTDTVAPAAEALATQTTPQTPAVTDPQIADIVVAANEVDIAAGEMARTRAADAEVKTFAEKMVTDHTGVNQAASELVGRLGVTPEPNATSDQLRRGGEQNRAALEGQSGAAFDRAYIDQEVAYHQAVLDAIDQTLIPSATNGELRALLQQTRPAVDAHLQHARQIQARLGGS